MKTIYIISIALIALLLGGALVYTFFPQKVTPADVSNVDTCTDTKTIVEVEKIIEKKVTKKDGRYQDFYDNNEPAKAYWTDKEGVEHKAGSTYTNEPTECARLHDKSLC